MDRELEGRALRAKAADAAKHLRLIADDVRAAGDVPLLRLSTDGVTREPYTLADELELVAIGLVGLRTE